MIIVTSGAATNEYGHVLLMQRNDSRTWALPGGGLEANELPTLGAAREVREETGIIVLPVRLVSLIFIPSKPQAMLSFVFRCIQRGGELATSEESLQVGWFEMNDLPRPMLSFHYQRLATALNHKGGPPTLEIERPSSRMRIGRTLLRRVVYPLWDWRRKRRGAPAYVPPPAWQIKITTILRNAQGHILWQQRKDGNLWHLPETDALETEAPWTTAVTAISKQTGLDIQDSHLSSITLGPISQELTLTFAANTNGAIPKNTQAVNWAYFAPGHELDNVNTAHITLVKDELQNDEITTFHAAQKGNR